MTDTDAKLIAGLRSIYESDHSRGCPGREYSCDCGFDTLTIKTAIEAATRLSAVIAERDEATTLLHRVSVALTSLTPGGSEYHSHSAILDAYYADVVTCVAMVRDRYASGHAAKIEAVDLRRRTEKAQADLDEMRKALEAAGYYIERLRTAYSGKPVRDLDEAGVAHDSLSAALLKQGKTP